MRDAPQPVKDCRAPVIVKDKAKRTGLAQLLAAVTVLQGEVPELALDDASPFFPEWIRVWVAGGFPSGKHLKDSVRFLRLLAKNSHCFLVQCKASKVVPKMTVH